RKPRSAMIKAVSSFCVLAAARISSGFFSYNVWPLFASTTITEAAPVFGMPLGVYSVGAGVDSGVCFGLACVRCERARVDFVDFWTGLDELSISSLSFAVTG